MICRHEKAVAAGFYAELFYNMLDASRKWRYY